MHALTVVAAFLGGGAAVTFIGAKLIERAHPPRGRFLEIGGLRQYVVELGEAAGLVNAPAIVLLHGGASRLRPYAAPRRRRPDHRRGRGVDRSRVARGEANPRHPSLSLGKAHMTRTAGPLFACALA